MYVLEMPGPCRMPGRAIGTTGPPQAHKQASTGRSVPKHGLVGGSPMEVFVARLRLDLRTGIS